MSTVSFVFMRSYSAGMAFARVELEGALDQSLARSEIHAAPILPTDDDKGEISPNDKLFWDAAVKGVTDAVTHLGDNLQIAHPARVSIRRIIGTAAYTSDGAVECAATLATIQLLAPAMELPIVGKRWYVHWS